MVGSSPASLNMFKPEKTTDKTKNYVLMVESAKAFMEGETDMIALLANLSALIKLYVDDLNWAGFYILKGDELVLGPFQGLPACTRIPLGKGVCGSAAIEGKTIIVKDVHEFPGHIACDAASQSELVIPFFKGGLVNGVIDLDSPTKGRFTELEAEYLGKVAELLSAFLDGS
ncbi:MAG: GAF domain-containing protein [Treponema sp.]|nr:GAF domain-containing protein [Treponema sp.]